VEIRTGDSHRIFDRDSGERINPSQSVSIGERVWLGKRSVVLKNVSIADGVIIGAGSMVTRSIGDENAVAVGNPARVVGTGCAGHSDHGARPASPTLCAGANELGNPGGVEG